MCRTATNDTLYDILARNEYDRLRERIGLKKADPQEEITRDLQDTLLTTWDAEYKDAINDAIRELSDGLGTLTDTEIETAIKSLEQRLGPGILDSLKNPLYEAHLASYELGQSTVLGTDFSFNLIDENAIATLHEHNIYWVRNHWNNNLGDDVAKIGEQVLREGLARKEAGELFAKELGERFQTHGTRYCEGYANHLTTRSREISNTSAYEKAGATIIEIDAIIDHRTSEICRGLNGKRITVERLTHQRDRILNAESPKDVKQIAPWYRARKKEAVNDEYEILINDEWKDLSNMDGADLPTNIALPPYHFDCRTTTHQVQ